VEAILAWVSQRFEAGGVRAELLSQPGVLRLETLDFLLVRALWLSSLGVWSTSKELSPGGEVRAVEPLAPQEGSDLTGVGAGVGLLDHTPLVLQREAPPTGRYFDLSGRRGRGAPVQLAVQLAVDLDRTRFLTTIHDGFLHALL